MNQKELQQLLAIKRRLPSPYRGHPRLFFGTSQLGKGSDYHWNGQNRRLTPWHPQVVFQYTFSGEGLFIRNGKQWKIGEGKAFIAIVPSEHIYELPPRFPGVELLFSRLSASLYCRAYGQRTGKTFRRRLPSGKQSVAD